jgi:DNA processing protein
MIGLYIAHTAGLADSIITLLQRLLIAMFSKGREIEKPKQINTSTYSLEELIGPLNDIEKKYAPKELHVTGRLSIPLPSPRVAVIGSRKASPEGLKAAGDISGTLARHNVTVVSGLAEGIDTSAHTAAIEEGGCTIAVLGTPLDRVYPRKNLQLQETIMRQHLLISQFPSGYPIQPKNFVLRNRTMALISDASIIVEAGDNSGSLHQGWEVLRLGRPLFIWTTIIRDSSLKWPAKMLTYGATELTDPKEVLEVLPSGRILEVAL